MVSDYINKTKKPPSVWVSRLKEILFFHRNAIFGAILVGFIAGIPQVIVKNAFGDMDQGIPYLVNDSEGEYLGRIHEILDGHNSVSSPVFYEYKDSISLMPPTGEMLFYVLPMKMTGLSLFVIIFLSRFIYPGILFLFVYLFIFSLLNRNDKKAKLSAIAGAFLITIGYDVADYRGFVSYLLNGISGHSGLIWGRLVNPITGAILLFCFLWLLVRIINKKDSFVSVIIASLVFSAMSGYIFSLALGFTTSIFIVLFFVWRKDYITAWRSFIPIIVSIVINASYFLGVFLTMSGNNILSNPRKQGMFITHEPMVNIVSIVTFLAVIICFVYYYKKDNNDVQKKDWWFVSLFAIVSCLVVYSQQIITGRTVWPQHFVQYTTPICMAITVVFLHNIFRFNLKNIWRLVIFLFLIISALCGYRIIASVPYVIPQYFELQSFSGVFDYLNKNAKKDCVVYVSSDYGNEINRFIAGFTSCNVYHSFHIYNGVPAERVMHNFLVNLRLRGISLGEMEEHFKENWFWTQAYFFRDWNDMFCCSDKWLNKLGNRNEIDQYLSTVEKDVEKKYAEYLKNDLYSELSRYRLDYFVVDTEKQPQINEKNFSFLKLETSFDRFNIYSVIKPKEEKRNSK